MPPKRKKTSTSSPTHFSPVPSMDSILNDISAKLDAMSAQLSAQLSKSDKLEAAIMEIKADLAAVATASSKKDAIILQHSDQINACEQSMRSTSLRILGLPVTKDASQITIINTVFDHIIHPVLQAAQQKGEIETYPGRRFIIDNAFTTPSKNPSSCPVIVKLTSNFVRSLIFTYKNDVLPKSPDPNTNRMHSKYAIFEDLTPANFAHLRSLTEDSRTTAIWTYNGQIKFRTTGTDTIYRVRSLRDTVDSILKNKPTSRSTAITPPP
jgi:hypothetical protein